MWVLPARQDEVLLMYLRLGRTAEKGEEKQQRKAGEGEEKRNKEKNRRAFCTGITAPVLCVFRAFSSHHLWHCIE